MKNTAKYKIEQIPFPKLTKKIYLPIWKWEITRRLKNNYRIYLLSLIIVGFINLFLHWLFILVFSLVLLVIIIDFLDTRKSFSRMYEAEIQENAKFQTTYDSEGMIYKYESRDDIFIKWKEIKNIVEFQGKGFIVFQDIKDNYHIFFRDKSNSELEYSHFVNFAREHIKSYWKT